jgi:DNA-binding NarL/FixJ family response regulator
MSRPTPIIAEDEAPLRAELRERLTQLWPDLPIVADCADGRQAIDALKLHRPDVAFCWDGRVIPNVGVHEVDARPSYAWLAASTILP